jgi:hypothetical protein
MTWVARCFTHASRGVMATCHTDHTYHNNTVLQDSMVYVGALHKNSTFLCKLLWLLQVGPPAMTDKPLDAWEPPQQADGPVLSHMAVPSVCTVSIHTHTHTHGGAHT